MNLPICGICAKTGILCNACEKKLSEGKITELDVELSKILYEMGYDDIGFEHVIDTENFIIILTKKENIGKIIGKSGDNIRHISKLLGKPVRAISTGDLQGMIHDFIAPARITSINKVYMPDGSIMQRVRINKKDSKKLRMTLPEIEKLISSITEDMVEISFD